jgi:hypothetical protein
MTPHEHKTDGTPCECKPTRESYAEPKPTYAERTERFAALVQFANQFGIWGAADGGTLLDGLRHAGSEADDDAVSARNLAALSTFRALNRIALES